MGRYRAELDIVQDTLKKRQTQLALLDKDLEQQLHSRHKHIKVCIKISFNNLSAYRYMQNMKFNDNLVLVDKLMGSPHMGKICLAENHNYFRLIFKSRS